MDKSREETIIPIVEVAMTQHSSSLKMALFSLCDEVITPEEAIEILDNYEVQVALVKKEA